MSKTNGRAKWEPIIQRFHESGKTAKQWAKEEGISYQSLVLWKRKLERLSSFIELDEPSRQSASLASKRQLSHRLN